MEKYVPKYFSENEFNRIGCSSSDCNPDSLKRLDALRELLGKPVVLNSAYRTVYSEKDHGRTGTSAHCLGRAFDIKCSNSSYRYDLVKCALSVGFHRIGIGERFVHVDDSPIHSPNVIWLY